MTIEAVVFDVGNVLLEWHPEEHYDARIGRDRREKLFAEVDIEGMNEGVDLGASLHESVSALAAQHPDWHDEIMIWHDDWLDMASPDIPMTATILRALKSRGVPVFSLTNFGRETYDLAAKHYPVLREFDRDFISGHMGVIKPDPEIYRRLESESGVAPEKLIFADDRADNIAAAAARGWQTHQFTNPEGWADRLIREGLLQPGDLS